MKFSSIATCKYCGTEHELKFNLEEIFDENGRYIASITFDIEYFYITWVCQLFTYMNLNCCFSNEQIKKYYQEKL